jgi:hypothetical protein
MGQFGFFDADKRLAVISAKGDPLEMIDRVVPFESFRAEIEAATLTPASKKKSNAGRKPIDVIVMFRMRSVHFSSENCSPDFALDMTCIGRDASQLALFIDGSNRFLYLDVGSAERSNTINQK